MSPTLEGRFLPLYWSQSRTDSTEPPEKKPYDVNYRVRTMQEIMDMQTKEVKKVQSLLEVPVSFLLNSIPGRRIARADSSGRHRRYPAPILRLELGEASRAILERPHRRPGFRWSLPTFFPINQHPAFTLPTRLASSCSQRSDAHDPFQAIPLLGPL